jgi:hypothetical protein
MLCASYENRHPETAPQRRRERRGKGFLMNKYSGLCDLRASAVNVFPPGFDSGIAGFSYGNRFFIRRVVPSGI